MNFSLKALRVVMVTTALSGVLATMPITPAAAKSSVIPHTARLNQGSDAEAGGTYSVKFLCGCSYGKIVPKGSYTTALNVHNTSAEPATLRLHSAEAGKNMNAGPQSKILEWVIQPGDVIVITCKDIWWLNQSKHKFFDGFVVLDASVNLQVVLLNGDAPRRGSLTQTTVEKLPMP